MAAKDFRPLAGLRGAQWDPDRLPSDMRASVHTLTTTDGANVTGYLYRCGGETAVAVLMHPREILATHYLVPELLEAGIAVWVQGSRAAGNDLRLEHELALLDVDAGTSFLAGRGYEKQVLVGNSGGGGLFAYYAEQASLAPEARQVRTPAGRPVKLSEAPMIAPDAMIFVAPHPGQGVLLMNSLDPSVTDETDPVSLDPSLFPFSKANGFTSDGASYTPEFVARYRAAQHARVERIDATALALVRARQDARKAGAEDTGARLTAGWQAIFTVPRTDADLRNWDLSLDPTDRTLGSLWGRDPFKTNMNGVGFGKVCTPESWLSTWSGLRSKANVLRCAPAIRQPTLVIRYTADACVFPEDLNEIFEALGASDKELHAVRGTHHGQPLGPGEDSGQAVAGAIIRDWLGQRLAA
ncbi:alpha/beta hydrolase [Arenibacterium halophilum]|uniref:Alpha/beta hydrolase n=1 Tax=Arenibacterium halophilum TaxID=2583821 RepID=A0ABY2X6W0_9RHOB|nr:alpha/beta hydrolase [Arenibacterium halophilum]TMV10778.1 alpha/beta hydrolase [Arenibacterium halophilum]